MKMDCPEMQELDMTSINSIHPVGHVTEWFDVALRLFVLVTKNECLMYHPNMHYTS